MIFILPVSSFTIFSNSRGVLSTVQHFNPSSFHPLVLKRLYFLQHRGYHVGFCWVPAHVEVQGNEKPDRLAKEAATRVAPSSPIPPMTYTPV